MRSYYRPAVWVLCIVLLSPLGGITAMAQNTTKIDSIVALVDDDVILRSELEIAIRGITDRIRQQGGDLPPRSLLEKQVLERLIIRRLQLLRAFQTGIRVSDSDIDQSLMMLADQNKIAILGIDEETEKR